MELRPGLMWIPRRASGPVAHASAFVNVGLFFNCKYTFTPIFEQMDPGMNNSDHFEL